MPTFGSLFAGIGGFDLGLTRAGWECAWEVEIDAACRRVLDRWGGRRASVSASVVNGRNSSDPGLGSEQAPVHFTDVAEVGAANLRPVDLVCGGFPCQDLSVAGRRKGLAGERSGLWFEFHRILAELAPRWVLIENVPGLLSSNEGRDMAVVVEGLAELGYGWAYRVLDAQYFGVAQRRRRVFIVGCAGDSARAAQVLFESESCSGDSPPSRTARQSPARLLAPSVAGSLGSLAAGGFRTTDLDGRERSSHIARRLE